MEEEPHYNLTTAANVRQPLMLLSLNFLYHPPSHLTLIAPQHKQHCNKKKKSALRRRTHLIDLGHATAVGHLKERTKQNKQKNKKAVSNCTVMLVHFHQAGHAGYPPPPICIPHIPFKHAQQHVPTAWEHFTHKLTTARFQPRSSKKPPLAKAK